MVLTRYNYGNKQHCGCWCMDRGVEVKAILITGAICAVIDAATGWMNAVDHYEAKASREHDAYVKALDEVNQRADDYKSISEEYYADYQEAINREPKNPIHSFAGVS